MNDLIPPKESNWTLNEGINPSLDTSLNLVKQDVTNHDYTPQGRHNLKPELREALKSIKDNPNLIVKPDDKGGAAVILDKTDYISKAEALLTDRRHY